MTRWGATACVFASLCLLACGTPPSKEMDQAQGAIDAARAAGAAQYATQEFTAATTALTNAHQAVTDRDYKLALSQALESREHAQSAAAQAADARAQMHADVERRMGEVSVLLSQVEARVQTAGRARLPRAVAEERAAAVAGIKADVQEAGAAIGREDFLAAGPRLDRAKQRISELDAAITKAAAPAPARRRR